MSRDKEKLRLLLEAAQREANRRLIEINRLRYERKLQARAAAQLAIDAARRR